MKRWIFFVAHFLLGFVVLWLTYTLAQYSFIPRKDAPLWLTGGINVVYLVAGVVWGNVGWDVFKAIDQDTSWSTLVYAITRTLAPVAIALPLIGIALDLFFQGRYLSWRAACTWQNEVQLGVVVLVLVLQRLYKRSEQGFFQSTWGLTTRPARCSPTMRIHAD